MGKVNLYTVRDKTAELCGPVFQAVNDGIAVRNVVHMLEKVAPYDRDSFQLLYLGQFDESSCEIITVIEPVEVSVVIPRFNDVDERKFGFEEGLDA